MAMPGLLDPLSPSSPAVDPGELLSWLEELDLVGPIDASASPAQSAAIRGALKNMSTDSVPSNLESQLAAALDDIDEHIPVGPQGGEKGMSAGHGSDAGNPISSLDVNVDNGVSSDAAARGHLVCARPHSEARARSCARAHTNSTLRHDSQSCDTGPWSLCARVDLAGAAFGTSRALSNPAFFPATQDACGHDGAIVVCGTEECDNLLHDRQSDVGNSKGLRHALVAMQINVIEECYYQRPETVVAAQPTVKPISAPVRYVAKIHTGSTDVFAAALGKDIVVSRGNVLQLDVQELQGSNFTAHTAPIRELAPCPHDQRLLASGGFDRRLLVHDLTTSTTVHNLPAATTAVSSVCWHPSEPCLCGWTEDGGSFAMFDTRQGSVATRFLSPRSSLYTHTFGMGAATHNGNAEGTLQHAVVLGYGDATLQLLDLRVLNISSTTSAAPQLEQIGEVLPLPSFASTRSAQPFFAFGVGAASGCTLSSGCAARASMLTVACNLPVLPPMRTVKHPPASSSTKHDGVVSTCERKLKTSGEALPWLDSLGITDTAGFVTMYKCK